jgi:hypothetical protein
MDKRMLLATLMFGSLWGLLECTLGAFLHLAHLPAGAVMASIAVALMTVSRTIYRQPGMQLGMGVIAASFKLLNLGFVGGCVWCAVVAIIAEAIIFEFMYKLPFIHRMRDKNKVLAGAAIGYACYSGGYILTEAVTPMFFPAGFYLPDLLMLMPLILGRGVFAAILTAIVSPVAIHAGKINLSGLNDRMYYPAMSTVTALCWIIAFTL